VTSRNQLTGLVVAEGAQLLPLDVLAVREARDLLAARLGAGRVAAEPDAVDAIIRRCARLPLALAIAAARAAAHPGRRLAGLAEELAAAGALDALEVDDAATDIRVAFSCSYAGLSPAAARLFRLLGLHPGPDCTVAAAARLAGLPERRTRAVVDELLRASLLTESAPDRFAFHDLLRSYARDLAASKDGDADRRAASRRMIDHYLHTAYDADRLIHPHRPLAFVPQPVTGAGPQPLADEAAAWAWLSAEHACLLGVQRLAAKHGAHRAVWQLAWALDTFHQRRGRPRQHLLSWQAGLAAAEREDEPAIQILARRRLGSACARAGQHAEADGHLHAALAQAARTGDLFNEAETHRVLAATLDRRGDHEGALEHATRALRLYRDSDCPTSQAALANAVGYYATRCGRHDEARAFLDEALALARRHSDRLVEANTLHSLGYWAQQAGRHGEAVELFGHCLRLCRDNGDPFSEATTLRDKGDSCAALGDHERARRSWRSAHRLLLDQRRWAEAEQVRERLGGAGQPRHAPPDPTSGHPDPDPESGRADPDPGPRHPDPDPDPAPRHADPLAGVR
jgi:tetratricopeptide (TPR) repeat protein